MKIYEFEESEEDQRAPHDSGRILTTADIAPLGIIAHHFDTVAEVDALASSRGYRNRDEITISPESFGEAYESKVKMFFEEHLHEDEEIRYIVDGAGYFDVRSAPGGAAREKWIRCRLEKGDLIVLPAGIYHRFTTDEKNYAKAMRLFKDEPKWTALNRTPDLEDNKFRKEYVQSITSSA